MKIKVHFIVYGCKSCCETDVMKQRAVRNISALILGNLQDLYTNTSRDEDVKPLRSVVSSSCKNVPDEPKLALLQVLLMSALHSENKWQRCSLETTQTALSSAAQKRHHESANSSSRRVRGRSGGHFYDILLQQKLNCAAAPRCI